MNDRDLLIRLAQAPTTGSQLGSELGLSRAAVWKRIQALRKAGVEIVARSGQGYVPAAPLDLLDPTAIHARLPVDVADDLETCDVVWEIDSTNAELLRRPATTGVQVLLAESQTAGRGRRGRTWASPLAAHVYLSLQRRFDGGIAALAGLSIAVGIAAAEALRALGFAEVGLKWPNDLVVGDRKLGGILIEFGGEESGIVRVVIGIGINVRMPASAAAGIDQPWTDLSRLDTPLPSRNELATALIAEQVPALRQFAESGLTPFLPRWQALDALSGRAVDVITGVRREQGVAMGIDARGALRVGHANGERQYHSAEISVRPR